MKIGMFTDTYYPQINGVATSVLMLKENLEKQGHEVYIFTTTDPKAPSNEVNVFRLPSIPFASERRVGAIYHPAIVKKSVNYVLTWFIRTLSFHSEYLDEQ